MNKILLTLCVPLLLGFATLHDPTEPPDYEEKPGTPSQGPLSLTAIFVYPEHSLVIINDQALTLGSHLGEYTITRIDPDTVELTGPQNTKEVLQLTTSVKQAR